jgi:hypothetical protein
VFADISQEMAINSYDIVSTLQALGMMKYWKGKHIILKKQVKASSSVRAICRVTEVHNRPEYQIFATRGCKLILHKENKIYFFLSLFLAPFIFISLSSFFFYCFSCSVFLLFVPPPPLLYFMLPFRL